ncbi:MAG TPA: DNA mismatch repair endonuclease MutL [Gemmatimonadaceae bacterium]|nr:DNA mismatch repair endonuclease MutL [Gemmatimonadaceae bacterium]
MPKIAILPGAVADQIAAGEVVERPASVVKELVENALDAGARTVDVTVEEGGRSLVRVADDGEGMEREDVLLAVARHATSKIRRAEDLVGVRSFGFRGEALPAICSVARVEIVTAPADGAGTRLRAEGGRVSDVDEAARRRGTTVSVGQLFYNTPARQKFLRGPRSEWRAVSDTLVTTGLSRRDVRFTLSHDGKLMLTLPPASSLRARLAAVWGGTYADSLLDVDDVRGTVHVSGLVERPADVGTRTRRTFLTVNGRPVRDAGIGRAVEAAFRSTLPGGLRPSYFLDLVLSADLVDVNVHPAKAEVRFHDRWAVERVVEAAVARALGSLQSAATLGRERPLFGGFTAPPPAADVALLTVAPPAEGLFAGVEPAAATAGPGSTTGTPAPPGAPSAEPATAPAAHDDATAAAAEDGILVPPLVQLRRTYLMFERDDGVVLIDQHSAHERVLYEAFMGALESGQTPAQRLLFPLTLHLGPAEADAFEEHQALFERLGFEVDGFGGHTLLVRAVPMPHPRFDAERCLRETLAALTGARLAGSATRHERLAATVACKAAVKAGDALSPAEMRALYLALARTRLPAHDVHGRATVVHLSWDELERRFGRR